MAYILQHPFKECFLAWPIDFTRSLRHWETIQSKITCPKESGIVTLHKTNFQESTVSQKVVNTTTQSRYFFNVLFVLCAHVQMYVCTSQYILGVRGQLPRVHSLLLCGLQRLNSGHQAWYQIPLPAEPFLRSHHLSKLMGLAERNISSKSLKTLHTPQICYLFGILGQIWCHCSVQAEFSPSMCKEQASNYQPLVCLKNLPTKQ